MSVSTAIAISASSYAIQADERAREAKKISCKAYIEGYKNTNATIESKQQYADCIELLYPKEMTHSDIILAKVFIVIALIGAVMGFRYGYKEHDEFLAATMFSMFGACLLPIAAFLVFGVFIGICFLFT